MEVDPLVLYRYTCWANDRVLEGARQLSAAQLTAPIRPGFHSPLGVLAHIMLAESRWLSRWKGTSLQGPLVEEFLTLDAVHSAWAPLRAEMIGFLSGLPDTNQVITYRNTKGDEFQNVLWHLISHVINHDTEHRSQVALFLAMQGIDVGELDFVKYVREHR
jgi:uncharacterized damage-inducible protein DinB